jgi:hypothetical protein
MLCKGEPQCGFLIHAEATAQREPETFRNAATQLDQWVRTGPKPDEPAA